MEMSIEIGPNGEAPWPADLLATDAERSHAMLVTNSLVESLRAGDAIDGVRVLDMSHAFELTHNEFRIIASGTGNGAPMSKLRVDGYIATQEGRLVDSCEYDLGYDSSTASFLGEGTYRRVQWQEARLGEYVGSRGEPKLVETKELTHDLYEALIANVLTPLHDRCKPAKPQRWLWLG